MPLFKFYFLLGFLVACFKVPAQEFSVTWS